MTYHCNWCGKEYMRAGGRGNVTKGEDLTMWVEEWWDVPIYLCGECALEFVRRITTDADGDPWDPINKWWGDEE